MRFRRNRRAAAYSGVRDDEKLLIGDNPIAKKTSQQHSAVRCLRKLNCVAQSHSLKDFEKNSLGDSLPEKLEHDNMSIDPTVQTEQYCEINLVDKSERSESESHSSSTKVIKIKEEKSSTVESIEQHVQLPVAKEIEPSIELDQSENRIGIRPFDPAHLPVAETMDNQTKELNESDVDNKGKKEVDGKSAPITTQQDKLAKMTEPVIDTALSERLKKVQHTLDLILAGLDAQEVGGQSNAHSTKLIARTAHVGDLLVESESSTPKPRLQACNSETSGKMMFKESPATMTSLATASKINGEQRRANHASDFAPSLSLSTVSWGGAPPPAALSNHPFFWRSHPIAETMTENGYSEVRQQSKLLATPVPPPMIPRIASMPSSTSVQIDNDGGPSRSKVEDSGFAALIDNGRANTNQLPHKADAAKSVPPSSTLPPPRIAETSEIFGPSNNMQILKRPIPVRPDASTRDGQQSFVPYIQPSTIMHMHSEANYLPRADRSGQIPPVGDKDEQARALTSNLSSECPGKNSNTSGECGDDACVNLENPLEFVSSNDLIASLGVADANNATLEALHNADLAFYPFLSMSDALMQGTNADSDITEQRSNETRRTLERTPTRGETKARPMVSSSTSYSTTGNVPGIEASNPLSSQDTPTTADTSLSLGTNESTGLHTNVSSEDEDNDLGIYVDPDEMREVLRTRDSFYSSGSNSRQRWFTSNQSQLCDGDDSKDSKQSVGTHTNDEYWTNSPSPTPAETGNLAQSRSIGWIDFPPQEFFDQQGNNQK